MAELGAVKPVPDTLPPIDVRRPGWTWKRVGTICLGVAAIAHGLGRMFRGEIDLTAVLEVAAGLRVFGLSTIVPNGKTVELVSSDRINTRALDEALREYNRKPPSIGGSSDDTDSLPPRRGG